MGLIYDPVTLALHRHICSQFNLNPLASLEFVRQYADSKQLAGQRHFVQVEANVRLNPISNAFTRLRIDMHDRDWFEKLCRDTGAKDFVAQPSGRSIRTMSRLEVANERDICAVHHPSVAAQAIATMDSLFSEAPTAFVPKAAPNEAYSPLRQDRVEKDVHSVLSDLALAVGEAFSAQSTYEGVRTLVRSGNLRTLVAEHFHNAVKEHGLATQVQKASMQWAIDTATERLRKVAVGHRREIRTYKDIRERLHRPAQPVATRVSYNDGFSDDEEEGEGEIGNFAGVGASAGAGSTVFGNAHVSEQERHHYAGEADFFANRFREALVGTHALCAQIGQWYVYRLPNGKAGLRHVVKGDNGTLTATTYEPTSTTRADGVTDITTYPNATWEKAHRDMLRKEHREAIRQHERRQEVLRVAELKRKQEEKEKEARLMELRRLREREMEVITTLKQSKETPETDAASQSESESDSEARGEMLVEPLPEDLLLDDDGMFGDMTGETLALEDDPSLLFRDSRDFGEPSSARDFAAPRAGAVDPALALPSASRDSYSGPLLYAKVSGAVGGAVNLPALVDADDAELRVGTTLRLNARYGLHSVASPMPDLADAEGQEGQEGQASNPQALVAPLVAEHLAPAVDEHAGLMPVSEDIAVTLSNNQKLLNLKLGKHVEAFHHCAALLDSEHSEEAVLNFENHVIDLGQYQGPASTLVSMMVPFTSSIDDAVVDSEKMLFNVNPRAHIYYIVDA